MLSLFGLSELLILEPWTCTHFISPWCSEENNNKSLTSFCIFAISLKFCWKPLFVEFFDNCPSIDHSTECISVLPIPRVAFNAPFVPNHVLNFSREARACCPDTLHAFFLHHSFLPSVTFCRRVHCVAAKFEQSPPRRCVMSSSFAVKLWSKRSSSQSQFVLFETVNATRFVCFVSHHTGELGCKRIKCKVFVQNEQENTLLNFSKQVLKSFDWSDCQNLV